MKIFSVKIVLLFFLFYLVSCNQIPNDDRKAREDIANQAKAIGSIPSRIFLDQAWDSQTREDFWFTSQGAQIIPYRWFMWLEQAGSEQYFRSAEFMELLRYLPVESSPKNPAGLPIGFALGWDPKDNTAWMGFTCAACHTNQLDYKGNKFLVDGAPTLANFVLFFSELVAALNETNKNDKKFDRFARNVLAADYSPTAAAALREDLLSLALATAERQQVNSLPSTLPKDFTSYARLDAFGNIQNAASAFALHDLNNKNIPNGPVSYPFLWGTHQSDVVQWNASAPNTPVVGPLVRNIGEVVGVFGGLSIEEAPWIQRLFGKKHRYTSTVDMIGLGHLESWVKTLRSPEWPEKYLPGIDAIKAADGAPLYAQHCARCHQVIPRAQEGDHYIAAKTPVADVGTDPVTAWNADFHMAETLILEGSKKDILVGEKFDATSPAIELAVNGVIGLVLKDPIIALEAGLIPGKTGKKRDKKIANKSLEDHVKDHLDARDDVDAEKSTSPSAKGMDPNDLKGLVYKGRPLNGVWATAPFLHNGSVPTLWELLKEPEQRATSFWVGNREFDPVHVGYKSDTGLSKFNVLDSSGVIQAGNSNRGHVYGTDLTAKQKWAIIEYMKTL